MGQWYGSLLRVTYSSDWPGDHYIEQVFASRVSVLKACALSHMVKPFVLYHKPCICHSGPGIHDTQICITDYECPLFVRVGAFFFVSTLCEGVSFLIFSLIGEEEGVREECR